MRILKTPAEIEIMAEAGRRLAGVLQSLESEVRAGVTTDSLEELSRKLIRGVGSKPAFLGYRPGGAREAFPAALCVSVNETVVHGRPSAYVIQPGDLVKLDLGLIYRDFYADAAITVGVAPLSPVLKQLIRITRESLSSGIKEARPGRTLGDIGWAIEHAVTRNKFSIVDSLSGHGIGRALHEDPYVFNFGKRGDGLALLPGMVLAIEPMVAVGKGKVKCAADDSFVTADGSLSAHFEHTVAITENGPRILTLPDSPRKKAVA